MVFRDDFAFDYLRNLTALQFPRASIKRGLQLKDREPRG